MGATPGLFSLPCRSASTSCSTSRGAPASTVSSSPSSSQSRCDGASTRSGGRVTRIVFTKEMRVEKLKDMHRIPVKRGLAEKPEEWPCSSFRRCATGIEGAVEFESAWTGWRREHGGSLSGVQPNSVYRNWVRLTARAPSPWPLGAWEQLSKSRRAPASPSAQAGTAGGAASTGLFFARNNRRSGRSIKRSTSTATATAISSHMQNPCTD